LLVEGVEFFGVVEDLFNELSLLFSFFKFRLFLFILFLVKDLFYVAFLLFHSRLGWLV
jgi:hypothetical protein